MSSVSPYDMYKNAMIVELALVLPDLEQWTDLRNVIGSRLKYIIEFQYASVAVIDPGAEHYRIIPWFH